MNTLIEQLDVSALATRAVEFVPKLFAAVIVLLLFWLIYRLTRRPLTHLLTRAGLHRALVRMLVGTVFRVTILVFGVVMAADQIGVNVGAALAGIGIAGIAIGFAAQDTLANVLAGFLIFMDKPFEVDDWITVADQYGEVHNITMRSTRIRTKRNTFVVIPNTTIINTVLVNHSKQGDTRVDVPVGIAYKENIPRARGVMLAAVAELEGVLADPTPDLVVTELGSSSVNMNLRVWINQATDEEPVFYRVLEAAKIALDDAGIEIPFPHMQLFVENIEDRVWQQLARHRPTMTGREGVS